MANKHEAKVLHPNMMSHLELCVIIPSSMADDERGFSVVKHFYKACWHVCCRVHLMF